MNKLNSSFNIRNHKQSEICAIIQKNFYKKFNKLQQNLININVVSEIKNKKK